MDIFIAKALPWFKLILFTFALVLSACGGGGSGSGPTGISYVGNTDPAVIDRSNAARLVGNILFGQTIAESSSGGAFKIDTSIDASTQGIGLAHFPGHLSQKLRNAMLSSPRVASRGVAIQSRTVVDETEPCSNSDGSLHITGVIYDNGTGTLTLDFINCREGDETLDGKITAQVNIFDFTSLLPTDVIYSFSVLTLTTPTMDVSIDGSIHSQLFFSTQSEQLTIDKLVARNNVTGEMLMITNQISIIEYDNIFFPLSLSENISGRIFDSTHGYVDFTTKVSITFSTFSQKFPDSGQLLIIGSLNSGIRITVISNVHTLLDLDLDGDSFFEISATLSWVELETEPDISDSDNDGMHDSWEQANGLDLNNPADAILDNDLDGAINIEEYLGGADPNDSDSLPPNTDIAITKNADPSAVLLGNDLTFSIIVTNNGPENARDVVVRDVLPTDMTFISAAPSQGSCIGNTSVTCNLGILDSFSNATIDIIVTPTTTVVASNTASVTSETLDLNLANNSATINVAAGVSASIIQAEIAAAVNGDTITVASGAYIGNIDFLGKAITVVSVQGPLVTIIDGAGQASPVVTFANGEGLDSVIDGFTIQNSRSGGIRVSSAAPTIVNNIIANNSNCTGAGIELAASSAMVRQNTIRNNFKEGCSGGTGGGGILIIQAASAQVLDNFIIDNSSSDGGGISMFAAGTPTIQGNTISGNSGGAIWMVNSSNALIQQNVISNNSDSECGGIDWLVPSGDNGPRVINNTIVDNDGVKGSAICADGFDAQAQIINNIIVSKLEQTAIYCGDFNNLEAPIIEFNNVYEPSGQGYGGICTDQTGINGNISNDPLFVDIFNLDYQLVAASPSIDAGDNSVPDLMLTDIIGNSRIIDGDQNGSSIVDMGAYEYNP